MNNYYPFGLTFNSYQRITAKENKYNTFQDQEKITALNLNWIQFKWRNHDPATGRFVNIDPMSEAFYYNSTYAFSENKVTTHIELEGLEAYYIHGTQSGPDMWTDDLTRFITQTLTSNTSQNVEFRWNYREGFKRRNWLLNNEEARGRAAKSLVLHILNTRNEDEHITLIGHSHGGNVAIQAAKLLFNNYGISVDIINFNTPAYNQRGDAENPENNFGIKTLTHFYTQQDGVAGGLAGSDKYNSPQGGMENILLSNPIQTGWMTSHFMHNVNKSEIRNKSNTDNNKKRKNRKRKKGGKKKKFDQDW